MAILCLVCVWHAIVGQLVNWVSQEFAKDADIVAFVCLLLLYLAFNAIFFTWSRCLVSWDYLLRTWLLLCVNVDC